jgi:hypothetical protein
VLPQENHHSRVVWLLLIIRCFLIENIKILRSFCSRYSGPFHFTVKNAFLTGYSKACSMSVLVSISLPRRLDILSSYEFTCLVSSPVGLLSPPRPHTDKTFLRTRLAHDRWTRDRKNGPRDGYWKRTRTQSKPKLGSLRNSRY